MEVQIYFKITFFIVDDINNTNISSINLLVMRFSQDITGSGDDGDTPALDYCLPSRSVYRTADWPLTGKFSN